MYNSYNATLKTPNLLIDDHKIFQEHDNNKIEGTPILKLAMDKR